MLLEGDDGLDQSDARIPGLAGAWCRARRELEICMADCPQCGRRLPGSAVAGLCPACLLKQGAKVDTSAPGVGGRFVPPSVEELGRHFPQLEILEQIGQGGMGAVYKARQPALDRLVALKILKLPATADPGFAERFIREAKTLARLSHPRIVAVHDYGQVDGMAYLILEFVDGASLREIVRSGRLTPREALAIVPQICEALQFAHDDGVVHRDIKPENILVDRKGQVKITDFGIAKLMGRAPSDDWLTGDRDTVGTPLYMAPEQVERPQTVDHRADIYSLGVVFYELLTGELPLGRFAPPSAKVQVDVRLDEVVLRTLEKEPERRYQRAGQVKTDVETIATSTGRISATPTRPGADGARDWSRWLAWGLGVAVVVLLMVLLVPAREAKPPVQQSHAIGVDTLPPVVVKAVPESGALDVAPGETEVRVTFSKPMLDGGWSWSTAWADSAPESLGDPAYLEDERTCVLRVRLEPGRTYGWWLNSERFQHFQDQEGRPAVPYLLIFQTRSEPATPGRAPTGP
jgi:hypothetical protein